MSCFDGTTIYDIRVQLRDDVRYFHVRGAFSTVEELIAKIKSVGQLVGNYEFLYLMPNHNLYELYDLATLPENPIIVVTPVVVNSQ